jgi:hypothetical protein
VASKKMKLKRAAIRQDPLMIARKKPCRLMMKKPARHNFRIMKVTIQRKRQQRKKR